jgi:translation initiation factor 2 gamma subunit (eIF-2gamma)
MANVFIISPQKEPKTKERIKFCGHLAAVDVINEKKRLLVINNKCDVVKRMKT